MNYARTDGVHEAFKSEASRFKTIKDIQNGNLMFFSGIQMVPSSPTWKFHIIPSIWPSTKVVKMYERTDTHTLVYRLTHSSGVSVVMKLYLIAPRDVQRDAENNKGGNVYGAADHIIEVRFLKLFSDLVQQNACPHFTLPVGHAILTKDEAFRLLLPDETLGKNMSDGAYMMLLSECADTNLNTFLYGPECTPEALRGLLFQVVFTLCVVQTMLPSFRHNDLHVANVLIQLIQKDTLKEMIPVAFHVKYTIENGQKFYLSIDDCPFRALLWDMHYSSISEEDARRCLLRNTVPVQKNLFSYGDGSRVSRNQYFDLHKFFDSLYGVLRQASASTSGRHKNMKTLVRDKKLMGLLERVVPEKLRCSSLNLTKHQKKKLKVWETHHITPEQVLRDAYFDPLRLKPSAESSTLLREYKITQKGFSEGVYTPLAPFS